MRLDAPTADAMVSGHGPLEALADHRGPNGDWWHDRLVDVIVYRDEIGTATEKPPGVREPRAE